MSPFHSTADSWPDTLEDSAARADLDWRPEYDLPRMVEVMVREIRRTVGSQRKREGET